MTITSYINNNIKIGISICTGSMNRTEFLIRSLESWLTFEQIDEIIIVDWSSEIPLIESLSNFKDPRIKIVRVESQINYSASKVNNLSMRLSEFDRILRIDADVIINNGFFESHPSQANRFWSGNWRDADNISDMHLNGTVFIAHSSFDSVNGYDERLLYYGWEDEEFFNRLEKTGLNRITFDQTYLEHQDHSMRIHNSLEDEIDEKFDKIKSMLSNERNKIKAASLNVWSNEDTMLDYNISKKSDNYFVCSTVDGSRCEDILFSPDIKEQALRNYLRTPAYLNFETESFANIFDFYFIDNLDKAQVKNLVEVTNLLHKYSYRFKGLKKKYDVLLDEQYSIKANIRNIFLSIKMKINKLLNK